MKKTAHSLQSHLNQASIPAQWDGEAAEAQLGPESTAARIRSALFVGENGELEPDPAIQSALVDRLQARRPRRWSLLECIRGALVTESTLPGPGFRWLAAAAVLFAALHLVDTMGPLERTSSSESPGPAGASVPWTDTTRAVRTAPLDTLTAGSSVRMRYVGEVDTFLTSSAQDTL